MNYKFLCDMLAGCKEYKGLKASLEVPYGRGKWRPGLVQGLSEGAFQLLAMTLGKDVTLSSSGRNRLLVICSEEKEASKLSELLRSASLPSVFYPAKDFNFSNIVASHDIEHERLSVLCTMLMTDEPLIICTTAEASLQTTMPQDILDASSVILSSDFPVDTTELCKKLTLAGYARVELVDGMGQFAVRGGIIDIFPPADSPVRIELFGDEIDRMGTFDVLSQRFCELVDRIIIAPVKELLVDDEAREKLRKNVSKRLSKLGASNPLTTQLLKRELSELENSASLEFADKYIGEIYSQRENLLSYFEGVVVIHDTSACIERVRASEAILEQAMTDMIENGEVLYSTDDDPYLSSWSSLMEHVSKMPSLFADVFNRSYNDVTIGEIFDFTTQSRTPYASNASSLMEDIAPFAAHGYKICVLCLGEAEERNLFKILFDEGFSPVIADDIDGRDDERYKDIFEDKNNKRSPIALLSGEFPSGFEFAGGKIALFDYSSDGIGKRSGGSLRAKRKKRKNTRAVLSSHDLEVGDFVVHEAYGIGQYEGIENLTIDGISRDYINIKYAGKDKLFLPVEQLDLVSKYIGGTDDEGRGIKLSKMGGADWNRSKARAKAATKDMAKELIELYAKRRRTPGIAFEKDDAFSREFADSFQYEETDSQLEAIRDLSRDMERGYPMDRIVCGDVGYGKTEVALRAAFKAVSSGYQVAILVPTTILAFQHYQTACARFRGFPVTIDMISRFRTPSEREASVRRIARGETDIIIGTHRLISKDISFKKLGLIIIDEEQRFGVAQKEKLKQLALNADVLTLTATPIPRTLNMAMGGILDMSVLDDVPGVRSPVQTYVMEHDDEILFEAMRRELRRGGQVFYLHNRVESIYTVAKRISSALPDARVAVGHGKLDRSEIEDMWASLVRGEIDILVSTTIIETGIDVPNANTLIIDNANRYGLSQLHQIRGRVGRSSRKAYAYFTYPAAKVLSEVAEKRLRAIKEYASFGAGFKIAMRDLEIRGAGNLLGAEQHGHLDSVGYDMYLKLLGEAVLEETGKTPPPATECAVSLRADAFIPKKYITHSGQRMEMYKKVATITDYKDYEDVIDEFCDRFGDMPRETLSLCNISYIRALGISCRVKKIEQRGGEIVLVPDSPDPFLLSEVASLFPKGAVRLSVAEGCTVYIKLKNGTKPIEETVKIMETYLEIFKKVSETSSESEA